MSPSNLAVDLDLARLDAGDIDHRNDTADDRGELDHAVRGQLGVGQRHVAGAEVDGLGLDLLDAAGPSRSTGS